MLVASATACTQPARLSGPLTEKQRLARLQACARLFNEVRGFAVVPFPGGGGVRVDKWVELSDREQTQMIDLVACLQRGGDLGPVEVRLINSDTREPYLDRRVSNNRDFAAVEDEV